MDTLSDEQLMLGVLGGETMALSVLVERHYSPLLVGYLYRFLGGNRPLAEDIAQETFLRVLQRGNYQPNRPFKPWLYTIAINMARDYFKSAHVRRNVSQDDEVTETIYDTAPSPEEAALANEQSHMVATALGQLSEEYRSTLIFPFLRMVATLLPPTEGSVSWNGHDAQTQGEELRQILGYLPQEFGLYPEFSARQFLRYMAAMKGPPRNLALRRSDEMIEVVNLERVADRKLKTYSGGMKQRVGIAQALLNDPELLIVVEPTLEDAYLLVVGTKATAKHGTTSYDL